MKDKNRIKDFCFTPAELFQMGEASYDSLANSESYK
jgi:hypothetical protein